MSHAASTARSRAIFGLLLAGVLGTAVLAVRLHESRQLPVPEWPLAVDLFLVVPLAYLVAFRPRPKQALLALATIVGLGVLFGSFVLPEKSKQLWLLLEPLRWAVVAGLVGWQLLAMAQIGLDLRSAPAGQNLETRLHEVIERRLGAGTMTGLLELEARIWLYAFCRDSTRLHFASAQAFSAHRQGGNASNQAGFLLLLAIELPIAHVMLHLFSPTLALAVTAATLYGGLFLFAEYRATRLRPVTLDDGIVHLRYGIVTDARLPVRAIVEAQAVDMRPRRASGRMRLMGMGRANVRLRLAPGTRLKTIFGGKEIAELYIGLDEPGRFIAAVSHH
ncbi:MAG: hypothetical protein HYZ20_05065 [Burkholderiales bacterium]|nr:hypothetical protein [Burkholderiales bacterium]